jgi:prophage regulatory protein
VEQVVSSLPQAPSILRLPAVLKARGRSRSTHYLDIEKGLFTHPVSLGARAVGWPDYEVAFINDARISGMSEAGIRALVASLEVARKEISPNISALATMESTEVLTLLAYLRTKKAAA